MRKVVARWIAVEWTAVKTFRGRPMEECTVEGERQECKSVAFDVNPNLAIGIGRRVMKDRLMNSTRGRPILGVSVPAMPSLTQLVARGLPIASLASCLRQESEQSITSSTRPTLHTIIPLGDSILNSPALGNITDLHPILVVRELLTVPVVS